MATWNGSVRHHRSTIHVFGQFSDLPEIRSAFLFGFRGRQIIDIQHDRTADEPQSLQQDFLLVIGQFQIDRFVHSANLDDELLAAFSAESVAAAAFDTGGMISVQFRVLNRADSSSSEDCGLATDCVEPLNSIGKSRR